MYFYPAQTFFLCLDIVCILHKLGCMGSMEGSGKHLLNTWAVILINIPNHATGLMIHRAIIHAWSAASIPVNILPSDPVTSHVCREHLPSFWKHQIGIPYLSYWELVRFKNTSLCKVSVYFWMQIQEVWIFKWQFLAWGWLSVAPSQAAPPVQMRKVGLEM